MAEAPRTALIDVLRPIFEARAEQLAATVVEELRQLGLEASVSFSAQPTVVDDGDLSESVVVATMIRLGSDKADDVWWSALQAEVSGAITTITAEHQLGDRVGWDSSDELKSELDGDRPELQATAEELMGYLADPKSVRDAINVLGLRGDDANVVEPDIRQQKTYNFTEQSQAPIEAGDEIGLSGSVRTVGRAVADREVSTAVEIAEALRGIHPEYAGGQLGRNELGAAAFDSVGRSWDEWLVEIRGLFDAEAVARTEEVIDGRLLLAALGVLDPPLLAELDRAGTWAQLLMEIDAEAIVGIPMLVEAKAGVSLAHGYRNDDPEGRDRLNIEGEVNALCEVVTDPAVKPPLAIGLFGEWGSGKSFFMEKMRQRIHELDQRPRAADAPRGDVVQIRFNAWHYSDSNLWASLAVEILSGWQTRSRLTGISSTRG